MARKIIVSILKDIHEREDLLIALLTLGKEAGTELFKMGSKLAKLSKTILSNIHKFKDSLLAMSRFVYFGEDYAKKIADDENRVSRILGSNNK